jgi:hypothetical protein
MKAIIRVLVVPRLTGIDITEDGLQDWPSRLTDEASFQLWTKTSAGVTVAGPPTKADQQPALRGLDWPLRRRRRAAIDGHAQSGGHYGGQEDLRLVKT